MVLNLKLLSLYRDYDQHEKTLLLNVQITIISRDKQKAFVEVKVNFQHLTQKKTKLV